MSANSTSDAPRSCWGSLVLWLPSVTAPGHVAARPTCSRSPVPKIALRGRITTEVRSHYSKREDYVASPMRLTGLPSARSRAGRGRRVRLPLVEPRAPTISTSLVSTDSALLGSNRARSARLAVMSGSIVARGLRAETPDRVLFDGLDLTIAPPTRLGVVGANGSGKSTLLAVLAGQREPAAGHGGAPARRPDGGPAPAGARPVEPPRPRRPGIARVTGVAEAEAEFAARAEALADRGPPRRRIATTGARSWTRLGCADFEARLGEVADDLGLDSPAARPAHGDPERGRGGPARAGVRSS